MFTQNLFDGLCAVVMSFAGCISSRFGVYADQFAENVGAMLYISSHLTFLMPAIIPPISLGAVGTCTISFHVRMRSPHF